MAFFLKEVCHGQDIQPLYGFTHANRSSLMVLYSEGIRLENNTTVRISRELAHR